MALSRQDWIDAAQEAFESGGPDRVSISELARTLNASRGSFYWHFTDHDDLLRAVLENWEWELTDARIAETRDEVDPQRRLVLMLEMGFTNPDVSTVDVALALHAEHPTIGPVLRRITDKRVGALRDVFRDLGFDAQTAETRALLAYSSFMGWMQLRHIAPEFVGHDTERSTAAAHEAAALFSSPQLPDALSGPYGELGGKLGA